MAILKNTGFAGSGRTISDYVFGGVTKIAAEPLINGDWTNYLPMYEYQNTNFETMACVTFSVLNCLEILLKRRYNATFNFSDRFTSKMSGTTTAGNTMYKVIESIRKNNGPLSQIFWRNEGKNWDEWYKEIPQNLQDLAKLNLGCLSVGYEWVDPTPDRLKEAMKYSPLQIAICAYGQKKDGIYQKTPGMLNHCITLYKIKDNGNYLIYDHYLGGELKELVADYWIGNALKLTINLL